MSSTVILFILVLATSFKPIHSTTNQACKTASLPVTWMDFPPYVFRARDVDKSNSDEIFGAIHGLAERMIKQCCGETSVLDLKTEVKHSTEVEENISGSVLAYPVTRRSQHNSLDNIINQWQFLPVIELPGSYVLIDLDTLNNVVLDALFGAWPLALLVLSAAGIAGFAVWFLDRSENSDHFPMSFVEGGWEGMWWAIVTATTVGYGDRAPRSIPARVFGLVWMLLGIILMSIFTATLVSAIQAEDKIGSDIKGAKVAVVSGSQEERYAFTAGAIPKSFATFEKVLDNLEQEDTEFALVDPFYALYFSDILKLRNIQPQDILSHTGVHGILSINMTHEVNECFAKYIAVKHHEAFGFMMHSLGSLVSMRGRTAHHTSHKLLGSNMILIYTCCSLFTIMFLTCCAWEFLCYKPKLRRLEAKLRSKTIRGAGSSQLSLLSDMEEIHSL